MAAFIVLLLAALSRLVPHAMHGVGFNFTAVGGGLLFFGARRPRSLAAGWQAAIAVAVMGLTDIYLTTVVFGRHFDVGSYLVTWAWYAAVCLMGSGLLRKVTALRVVAGVFASATSFFLLSNFITWIGVPFAMYPHSLAGLSACYTAGVPFYANDLASTGLVSAALFGLPVLAARMTELLHASHRQNQPLA